MVLHMLRKKLGDTQFFQGMKDYLANSNLAYNYAKTPDFISHMEAASGQNLTEFFNDWIYNQGYPSYEVQWYQPNADQIKITINQTQSHASVNYFEAPVPVKIHGSDGEVLDVVLNNTFNGEEFLENVTFPIVFVELDPETHLISRLNSVVLGLENVAPDHELTLYPNPVSETLFIKKPANILIENIAVFNILGQVECENSKLEKIEVSQLTPGVYFIQVETNEGSIYKSFLKH